MRNSSLQDGANYQHNTRLRAGIQIRRQAAETSAVASTPSVLTYDISKTAQGKPKKKEKTGDERTINRKNKKGRRSWKKKSKVEVLIRCLE